MKNLKTLKVFLFIVSSTQILLISPDCWGWRGDPHICLTTTNWDEKMTVTDYMDSCDGAITNIDGCKLNYEKACVNGVEVDLSRWI
jgi:hypothetical protein